MTKRRNTGEPKTLFSSC